MAKFSALTLWTDSWVADTAHLTRLERGTYMDLLVLMWRTPGCKIPNDNKWLAKHLRMSDSDVSNELIPLIKEFCQTDGNRIWQKRLLHEYEWSWKKSDAQRARAKSRWNKEKGICPVDAAPHTSGNASPTPTLTLKESKKDAAKEAALNGSDQASPEKELFSRGKKILGENAGGLITKLLKNKEGNVALARAAIETASTKQDPREWIGRFFSEEEKPKGIRNLDYW